MSHSFKQVACAVAALLPLLGAAGPALAQTMAPPPPRAEVVPAPPPRGPGVYWAWHAGYWRWNGRAYRWVPATMSTRPAPRRCGCRAPGWSCTAATSGTPVIGVGDIEPGRRGASGATPLGSAA